MSQTAVSSTPSRRSVSITHRLTHYASDAPIAAMAGAGGSGANGPGAAANGGDAADGG